MKKIILFIFCLILTSGCAHTSLFAAKPANFKIIKVNSQKKYLQMMSRMRGILGTSSWGKFNYDVVELPYDKQGEYFIVEWKRSGGKKRLDENLVVRLDYKQVDGFVGQIEKVYSQSKKGRHFFVFENTGDFFVNNGEIVLWKVTLLLNGEVVAEKESRLWWTVGRETT